MSAHKLSDSPMARYSNYPKLPINCSMCRTGNQGEGRRQNQHLNLCESRNAKSTASRSRDADSLKHRDLNHHASDLQS